MPDEVCVWSYDIKNFQMHVANKTHDNIARQVARKLIPANYSIGLHTGDDITKAVDPWAHAVAMNRSMMPIGLAGGDVKLLIEERGGVVTIQVRDKRDIAYLNRATAVTVSGNMTSKPAFLKSDIVELFTSAVLSLAKSRHTLCKFTVLNHTTCYYKLEYKRQLF